MLEFLGEAEAATRIRAACADPESIAGGTREIGDLIAGKVA